MTRTEIMKRINETRPRLVLIGNFEVAPSKVTFQTVDQALYLTDEVIDRVGGDLFATSDFAVPSKSVDEVVWDKDQYPEYVGYNHEFVERFYPNYYSCDEVMVSDILCRIYEDKEYSDEEMAEYTEGKPSCFTDMEWIGLKMVEANTYLMTRAIDEAKCPSCEKAMTLETGENENGDCDECASAYIECPICEADRIHKDDMLTINGVTGCPQCHEEGRF